MNTLLLSINWNPNPELFNLFGLSIRYYGLLWAVGMFFRYSDWSTSGALPVLRPGTVSDKR